MRCISRRTGRSTWRRSGCDFLVCSAYKFFGPHVGILFGRRELLERHRPYKVRPACDVPPGSWETGTVNLEGIAGTAAAARYLTGLGMDAVQAYEHALAEQLIDGLDGNPGVTVYGTRDLARRVPTVVFTVAGRTPAEVSGALAERGIFVWDGNYYAMELMQRLGLDEHGGAVRVGAVHYNTPAEIDRFLEAVADQASSTGDAAAGRGFGDPLAVWRRPRPAQRRRRRSASPVRARRYERQACASGAETTRPGPASQPLVADRELCQAGDDDVHLLLAGVPLVMPDLELLAGIADHRVDPERVESSGARSRAASDRIRC